MAEARILVLVKFRSSLSFDEVNDVAQGRIDEFRALGGLKQKYYLHNPETGEYGGLYLWESAEAFAEYRDSELRASIGGAYQTENDPEVSVFQIFETLRDDAS